MKAVRAHASFLVLGTTALSLFCSILYVRYFLDTNEQYSFNVLITAISIYYSMCFLGSEQMLARLSIIKNDKIYISKQLLYVLLFTLALFTILFSILSELVIFQLGDIWMYILLALSVGISVFSYHIFRLKSAFVVSQLSLNLWKIIILLLLILLSKLVMIRLLIYITFIFAILFCIYVYHKHRRQFVYVNSQLPKDWRLLLVAFGLSLSTIAILNSADRIIANKLFSQNDFNQYFFLSTVLIMPFAILANYFGFRELANFKSSFTLCQLTHRLKNVILLTTMAFCIWCSTILFVVDANDLDLSIEQFFVCLLIVNARCMYALVSLVVGLHSPATALIRVNIMSLIALSIVSVIAVLSVDNLQHIFVYSGIIWSLRLILFALIVRKIPDVIAT